MDDSISGVSRERISEATERLHDIGLERHADYIITMDLNGPSFEEHIDWILTADADEIIGWARDMDEAEEEQ